MSGRAWVVLDLGFGDAGKGATTDFLVRERGAGLVVRAHGGAQSGHNVVTADGRHHTFSQWGAGSLVAGVQTLLGPDFVLHPGALLAEALALARVGVSDPWPRLQVDARATVVSPYQQVANHLREWARAEAAHGTCGVGVGEAVGDALAHPEDALRAGDLRDPGRLRALLSAQRARKRAALAPLRGVETQGAPVAWALLDDPASVELIVESWAPLRGRLSLVEDAAAHIAAQPGEVVFEGAQGVLLDQRWGFHPHTTWSDCTPASARTLAGDRPLTVLGVSRTYSTRHGAGPMPAWDPAWDARLPEPHNDEVGWQGCFRRGPLDLVLLRYALRACGGVDGLALNHLDRLPGPIPVVIAYEGLDDLLPGADLGAQARLALRLAGVRPRVVELSRPQLYEALGATVQIEGVGPTAGDRRWVPGGALSR